MATIEKRTSKTGAVTYRITVAGGFDISGKQIRHRRTWKPDSKMTSRQLKKALERVVTDFEREIEQGYQIDRKQSFSEYAGYVIDLKERTGIKPRTIDRYRELMVRIDAAIGYIKLSELRPQHLNAFYKNLSESGIRTDGNRAIALSTLPEQMNQQGFSKASIARKANVAASTVSAAIKGTPIKPDKAEQIAAALGLKCSEVFLIKKDSRPLSNKTIQEYHALISAIMAQAEKEMLIPFNPASKATPPKVQKKSPDYYQPEQMDAILEALDSAPLKRRTITYFKIDTGCRRGEAVGLKWESIDFNTGIVTIERASLYSAKRGIYEGTTKTDRERPLKLAPETLSLLKQYRTAQYKLRLVNGDRWQENGYVFTQPDGQPMHPDSITDWLNKFSRAHNLPHIHPHAFRHTAASIMIADGIDLVTTANELGHANATTTAAIYAHQISQAKAKASETRAGVFSHRKQIREQA